MSFPDLQSLIEAADSLTSVQREELTRLRRENRQLRLEREILPKAAL